MQFHAFEIYWVDLMTMIAIVIHYCWMYHIFKAHGEKYLLRFPINHFLANCGKVFCICLLVYTLKNKIVKICLTKTVEEVVLKFKAKKNVIAKMTS